MRVCNYLSGEDMDTEDTFAPSTFTNVGITPKLIELDRASSIMLDSREWTDQEVLRLMEGIEKYKDDWNKVRHCSALSL